MSRFDRNQFPHDKDNRIQNMYYDINIHTIFNRTKLQNIKNKFIKYGSYLIKYEKYSIQPEVSRLEYICHIGKYTSITPTIQVRDDPTPENYKKLVEFNNKRERYCVECSRYMNIQKDFNNRINDICIRIRDIKMQQNKSRNHYKKYYCC